MNWTSIEKKWNEMAQRLQTPGPVTATDTPADVDVPRSDLVTATLPEGPGTDEVGARAMA